MSPKKQHKDFESALARLEEITEQMESGEVSLEQSIALYTEGLDIARVCGEKLSGAEKKIKVLREKSGLMTEEQFDEDSA